MNSLEWRVNLVREGFQKELNLKMVSKLGFKYLEETKHQKLEKQCAKEGHWTL